MGKKIFIIIQARMTSTRLAGKVLLPLCEKTVLEVMLKRLKKFKNNITIATTDDGSEMPITQLCEKNNIEYFMGDASNVLDRYYRCAKYFDAKSGDIIVRLTSDCPLIDGEVVEKIIDYYKKNSFDYVSNVIKRTFPRGFDCEVFSFDALKKAYKNAASDFEKEHVTTYIHTTHKDEFKIGSYEDSEDNSKYRLTLDEKEDYEAIKEVYSKFGCKTNFDYKELLAVLKANEYIFDINSHIEQKKS